MTASTVAKRYAEALADVVTGTRSTLSPQATAAELREFERALESSRELREVLSTPAVPVGRKRAVIGRVAEMLGLSGVVRNFLFVLIDHHRLTGLSEIVRSFEAAVDERLGFALAEVKTARELTGAQRAALTEELERLTGKRIRMNVAVDESLIGGVAARIGSTIYDGSVRGRLDSLARRLAAEN